MIRMPKFMILTMDADTFNSTMRRVGEETYVFATDPKQQYKLRVDSHSVWEVTPDAFLEKAVQVTKNLRAENEALKLRCLELEASGQMAPSPSCDTGSQYPKEVQRLHEEIDSLRARNADLEKSDHMAQKRSAELEAAVLEYRQSLEQLNGQVRQYKSALENRSIQEDTILDLERRNDKLTSLLNQANLEVSELTAENKKLVQDNNHLAGISRTMDDTIAKLDSRIKQDAVSIEHLENVNSRLSASNASLNMDLSRYMRLELGGMLRDILECISNMYNRAMDTDDLDDIRKKSDFFVDMLQSRLLGYGVELRLHKRGVRIGDEDILPSSEETGVKELDRTVMKCRRIGCAVEGIPSAEVNEEVVVWRYNPDLDHPEAPVEDEAHAAADAAVPDGAAEEPKPSDVPAPTDEVQSPEGPGTQDQHSEDVKSQMPRALIIREDDVPPVENSEPPGKPDDCRE